MKEFLKVSLILITLLGTYVDCNLSWCDEEIVGFKKLGVIHRE